MDHFNEVKRNVKKFFILIDQMKGMVIPSTENYSRFEIHKTTFVFSRIVSNFGTASYKLARFLSQSLT